MRQLILFSRPDFTLISGWIENVEKGNDIDTFLIRNNLMKTENGMIQGELYVRFPANKRQLKTGNFIICSVDSHSQLLHILTTGGIYKGDIYVDGISFYNDGIYHFPAIANVKEQCVVLGKIKKKGEENCEIQYKNKTINGTIFEKLNINMKDGQRYIALGNLNENTENQINIRKLIQC